MTAKKKKDSDMPETQPEGLSPKGDEAFEPDENTLVPFDHHHDVLLKLEAANERIKELEEGNDALAKDVLDARIRIEEVKLEGIAKRDLLVHTFRLGNEKPFDPDQVETHHLNPSELPSWVLAKLPESLTVDTSKFQEPNVAYAIRFAIGRGAKEGDIVHFCAGV
jgi:hypothetical protein